MGCVQLARGALKKDGRKTSPVPLLTAAILCGIVLAYLIVEIQPRYRYVAMPFIFIMACVPFARSAEKS